MDKLMATSQELLQRIDQLNPEDLRKQIEMQKHFLSGLESLLKISEQRQNGKELSLPPQKAKRAYTRRNNTESPRPMFVPPKRGENESAVEVTAEHLTENRRRIYVLLEAQGPLTLVRIAKELALPLHVVSRLIKHGPFRQCQDNPQEYTLGTVVGT